MTAARTENNIKKFPRRRDSIGLVPRMPACSEEPSLALYLGNGTIYPTSEPLKQIQNIRGHIKKGCLSGIPLGFVTERNEHIPNIKPFTINCNHTNFSRISDRFADGLLITNKCNAKVHFIKPARKNAASTGETMSQWSLFKTESSPINVDVACQSGNETTPNLGERNESSPPELLIVEDINDVCTETVAQCIFNVSVSAKNTINSLSIDNCNRSYRPEDLLLIADNPDGLSVDHSCADDSEFSSLAKTKHQVRLSLRTQTYFQKYVCVRRLGSSAQDLATSNRIINPSVKGSDCAFHSD